MKRLLLFVFALTYALVTFAQLNGNGFYRIQNYGSERYLYVRDNRGKVNVATTDADLGALQLWKDFGKAVYDPSSVVYITNVGSDRYRFKTQGCDSYSIVGHDLTITESHRTPGAYRAGASKAGMTAYLADGEESKREAEGVVVTNETSKDNRYWKVHPVQANSEFYFGIRPEFAVGTDFYATIYADFQFTFASSGMTAYYVKRIDRGMAIIEEIKGAVSGSTPVIIKMKGATPSGNRLNLAVSNTSKPSGNLLGGVYFKNTQSKLHRNVTPYKPETMRLLTVNAEGKLVFATSNIDYLPANKAYLKVPAGSPHELLVVTQKEFDEIVAAGIEDAFITERTEQTVYNMLGVAVGQTKADLKKLPAGIYIVAGKKYIVK